MLAVAGLRRRSGVGAFIAASGAALIARGSTGHCPAYARIDALREHKASGVAPHSGIQVSENTTINRPPEVLYEVWRTLELLPQFIPSIKSVSKLSETRSHWVVTGPAGREVEWDAETVNDVPNQLIAWRSEGSADVPSEGSVRFSKGRGPRETVMEVQFLYDPPLARVSAVAAWLTGREPGQLVRDALRRFKSFMESGEAPTTEGQPRGQQSVLNYD